MAVKGTEVNYSSLSELSVDAASPGYKLTEAGVVPEDWEISTVGVEFSVQLGKMLDAEKNIGTSKPFLGNRAVQWGRVDPTCIGQIKLTARDLQRYRLRDGDLLVCEGGEVGRAAIWRNELDECYYQKALHRLRSKRGYSPALMLNVLRKHAASGVLQNFVTQTSIAHLPKDKFEEVPIPLPGKVEQEAIAETLSDADTLIESLEQLIAKKRQIKQGTMQALLTGKQRLPGFNDEWQRCHLADLVAFHKGKGLPKSALDAFALTPCIHYGELFTQYAETIREVISYTGQFADALFSCVQDVLMPTSDVTPTGLAKASCVMMKGVVLGGDILVIRPDTTRLYGPFLSYVIRYSKHQILQLVTGSTVFHIYASDMKKFTIAVPSVKEQEQIIRVLDDMDSELAELETRLAKTRQLKQGMMQELLTGRIRLV